MQLLLTATATLLAFQTFAIAARTDLPSTPLAMEDTSTPLATEDPSTPPDGLHSPPKILREVGSMNVFDPETRTVDRLVDPTAALSLSRLENSEEDSEAPDNSFDTAREFPTSWATDAQNANEKRAALDEKRAAWNEFIGTDPVSSILDKVFQPDTLDRKRSTNDKSS